MLRDILEMLRTGCVFAAIPFIIFTQALWAPAFYVAVVLFVLGCGHYIGFNSRRT